VIILYELWTDGACRGNGNANNRGAYGYLIIDDVTKQTIKTFVSEVFENTTNNRMELLAVIQGLRCFKSTSQVVVFSDSLYVVNGVNKSTKKTANKEMWGVLDLERTRFKHSPLFSHIKGHAGHERNEMIDKLIADMLDGKR
jgi:ribonuclease HI